MYGIPALDFWDVVMEVLHSSNNKKSSTLGAAGNGIRSLNTKLTGNQNVDQVSDLDHVATNASPSQCDAELYIFEDNGAVIKMIIKFRSSTMRHVSRTYRDALDLLFDRVNLDPEIQIRYIDTKHQMADTLTQGKLHT